MNKKILLNLVILISLFYVIHEVNSVDYCVGVSVCPSPTVDSDKYNFYVACKAVSDSYCPENYTKGSWTSFPACPQATVGRCYPCDPDCSACPKTGLIITNAVDVGGTITAICSRGYNSNITSVNLKLNRANGPQGVSETCNQNDNFRKYLCNRTWVDPTPPETVNPDVLEGGNTYCYNCVAVGQDGDGQLIQQCGSVRPQLNLTVNFLNIKNNDVVTIPNNLTIRIDGIIHSKAGITKTLIEVYKLDKRHNTYAPINLDPSSQDYCSFRCPNNICSPLASYQKNNPQYNIDIPSLSPPTSLTGNIDGTRCENTQYTVNLTAYDTNFGNVTEREGRFGINLVIANTKNVCTDECPIFTSKTLNIVVSKIKTWISPSS